MMTHRELLILNSLLTFAAEQSPGGLRSEEQGVVQMVAMWTIDGVPVRQVCPHCSAVAPVYDGHERWIRRHIHSSMHRLVWSLKNMADR